MGVIKTSPGRDMFLLLLVICDIYTKNSTAESVIAASFQYLVNLVLQLQQSTWPSCLFWGKSFSMLALLPPTTPTLKKKLSHLWLCIQHTKGAWLTAQIRALVIGHRQMEVVDDIGNAVKCEKGLLVQPKSKTT